jgi:hypothetical protein
LVIPASQRAGLERPKLNSVASSRKCFVRSSVLSGGNECSQRNRCCAIHIGFGRKAVRNSECHRLYTIENTRRDLFLTNGSSAFGAVQAVERTRRRFPTELFPMGAWI